MTTGDAGSAAVYFDDLKVGDSFPSGHRTITEDDVDVFATLSGDFNPLHTDEAVAEAAGFPGPIAHGALVLSAATGLRQQTGLFRGTLTALLEIRSWRFLAPVRPGDTVTTVTTIEELRPSSKGGQGIVVQRVDVLNQHDETVQSGELVTLLRSRS